MADKPEDDYTARFRASLDALLYYDRSRPASPVTVGVAGAGGIDPVTAAHTATTLTTQYEPRPNDRKDYTRRVSSFRPALWFAKPPGMRAVDCARRGWVCVGSDLLQCESCNFKLIFKVPAHVSSEDARGLAAKTVPRLDANHAVRCGWRGRESPVSVTRFPRASQETLLVEFEKRRNDLLTLDLVPHVEMVSLSLGDERFASAAVSKRVERAVASFASPALALGETAIEIDPTQTPDRIHAATLLSLCGWTVHVKDAWSDTAVGIRGMSGSMANTNTGRTPALRLNPATRVEKVKGSILRCALCDARCATWNFVDTKQAERTGLVGLGFEELNNPTQNPKQPLSRAKTKPKASAAAMMGAMGGGGFGNGAFAADAVVGNPLSPLVVGTKGVLTNLSFSIAGGGTPSKEGFGFGFGVAGGSANVATNRAPAFGVGAVRDAPFGVPGRKTAVETLEPQVGTAAAAASVSPAPNSDVALGKRKHNFVESDEQVPVETTPVTPQTRAVGSGGTPRVGSVGTPGGFVVASTSAVATLPPVAPLGTPGAFHPLHMHRAHCAWVSVSIALTQGGGVATGGQPGWQRVLDAVAPFSAAECEGDAGDNETQGESNRRGPANENLPGSYSKPPGRLGEYSSSSGRAAVASYLAGGT